MKDKWKQKQESTLWRNFFKTKLVIFKTEKYNKRLLWEEEMCSLLFNHLSKVHKSFSGFKTERFSGFKTYRQNWEKVYNVTSSTVHIRFSDFKTLGNFFWTKHKNSRNFKTMQKFKIFSKIFRIFLLSGNLRSGNYWVQIFLWYMLTHSNNFQCHILYFNIGILYFNISTWNEIVLKLNYHFLVYSTSLNPSFLVSQFFCHFYTPNSWV